METNGPSPSVPGFTAVCSSEHFTSGALQELIREMFPDEAARAEDFPAGAEHRKHWEAAMTVLAFRELGVLGPASRILGVGAGMGRAVFHLTRHVAEVVATDLYLGANAGEGGAPVLMLTSPRSCTRVDFASERLTVRHMDGRVLDFSDGSFDGVFCPGSIGRFGPDGDIAASAYEMGRVLRPGGILTVTADFLVMGPPGANGWPGCRLFSEAELGRLIVEASGLDLVEGLRLVVSPATLETPRDMSAIVLDRPQENGPGLPHLVDVREGQVFTSVQLTLRKPGTWPATDNSWAAPGPSLREAVRRYAEETAGSLIRTLRGLSGRGRQPSCQATTWVSPEADLSLADAFDAWDAVRARTALTAPASGPAWRRALAFATRTAARVRDLGIVWDRERDVFRALIERVGELEGRLDDAKRTDRG